MNSDYMNMVKETTDNKERVAQWIKAGTPFCLYLRSFSNSFWSQRYERVVLGPVAKYVPIVMLVDIRKEHITPDVVCGIKGTLHEWHGLIPEYMRHCCLVIMDYQKLSSGARTVEGLGSYLDIGHFASFLLNGTNKNSTFKTPSSAARSETAALPLGEF